LGARAEIRTGQQEVQDREGSVFSGSEHVAGDSERMSERDNMTVAELKEKLKARGLSTTGAKSELMLRLQGADPTGSWMESVASGSVEDGRDEARESVSRGGALRESAPREDIQRREIELHKREKELVERELDLARREILQLRGQLERNPAGEAIEATMLGNGETSRTQPRVNLTTVADLLDGFDGVSNNYDTWEKRLKFLKATYRLDDDCAKLLIGMRLKERAFEWFHSRPEYIEMSRGFWKSWELCFDTMRAGYICGDNLRIVHGRRTKRSRNICTIKLFWATRYRSGRTSCWNTL